MKGIHIMLVEDNEGDILLTQEAFEERRIINRMSIMRDGAAAVSFFENLAGEDELPDLVLLDINLPKKNGLEVLSYLKSDTRFRSIPVIILTTSSSQKDIQDSYSKYANCFITKPVEAKDFLDAVGQIEDFWINIVSIPRHD